jgi:hypothetical protein
MALEFLPFRLDHARDGELPLLTKTRRRSLVEPQADHLGAESRGGRLVRTGRSAADAILWNRGLLSCFLAVLRGRQVRTIQDKKMKRTLSDRKNYFFMTVRGERSNDPRRAL